MHGDALAVGAGGVWCFGAAADRALGRLGPKIVPARLGGSPAQIAVRLWKTPPMRKVAAKRPSATKTHPDRQLVARPAAEWLGRRPRRTSSTKLIARSEDPWLIADRRDRPRQDPYDSAGRYGGKRSSPSR